MKKSEFFMRLVATYLSCLLLFFDVLPAVAGQSVSKAPVKGLGCAEKRDDLSLKQVREKAEKEAYKDALKSFLVFTKSEFVDLTSNDTSLVVNSINTMAVGYIYGRKLKEADKDGKICFEVTGEVILGELKELIEISSGIDRGYESEFRRQRDQYMEDERSAAKKRNDIEQSLIVKKGKTEKLKGEIFSQIKSISAKKEEYEKAQREYNDLLDMERRTPGSLNESARSEKGEKVKMAKADWDRQRQKLDSLINEQDKVNSELRQANAELAAIEDSLNKKKADLASFVFKSPVRVVFSDEVNGDTSSSANSVKKQAESAVQEKARYFASVFMLSRLADLPPSIEIDFPSSGLEGKLLFVQDRIIPSKMQYQDLEGKQSSGAVWIKDAGDYGKAEAMLKAAYAWKGPIPLRIAEMVKPQVSGGYNETASSLFITSDPTEAEVLLNGVAVGTTPYQNLGLIPNQQITVALKKEMYHVKFLEFTLAPGTNKLMGVKLAPAFGSLTITSSPSGAEVWLGDNQIGVTPYSSENIKSGQYLLTLKKPLYTILSNQGIAVEDGKETKENYTLSSHFGTLKVSSNPSGSNITVLDAKGRQADIGQTPYIVNLEPGSYRLKVEQDGYEPVEANATIVFGKTFEISEDRARLRRLEGKVTVTTEPLDVTAEVYVDGMKVGNVPTELTLATGTHDVSVKTTKEEGKASITVKDRKSQTVSLKLQDSAEIVLWNRIKDSNNLEAFKAYVNKYPDGIFASLAKSWMAPLERARAEQERDLKAAHRQAKLDQIDFFEFTKNDKGFDGPLSKNFKNDPAWFSTAFTLIGWWMWPVSTALDIIVAPTNTSAVVKVYYEAALRPSTWGKPDSMIARASRQMQENGITSESSQFAVAQR